MDTIAASSNRIYEDFEPFCKWHSEEAQNTLDINLKGFKKEQLKVQVNNKGILAIFGERPLDASKWSRFLKEVKLPKHSVEDEIQAKFSQTNGILSIVMPKKVIQRLTKEPEDKTKDAVAISSGTGSEQKLGLDDKGSVWGVKISKKRAVTVAVVVAVVVTVVAIGTQIAQLVHGHPRHHLAATNDHVFNV